MSSRQSLSIDEAAQVLGISPQKVQNLIDRGALQLRQIDGERRIPERSLLDYRRMSATRSHVPLSWQVAAKPAAGAPPAAAGKPAGGDVQAPDAGLAPPSKPASNSGMPRGLDGQHITLEDAQKRLLGKIDPRLRQADSLELDLSVLEDLRSPLPQDPEAPAQDG